MIGEPISLLIPRDRAGEEKRILKQILAGEQVEHYETERVRKDGTTVMISLSVSPIQDAGGEITGASVIARDITERRRSIERAERLQRTTESLSRAISTQTAAEILIEEALPAVAADAATVAVVDREGERLELVASRGYTASCLGAWRSFPASADLPMSAAVRSGKPIWSSSPEEIKQSFSGLQEAEFVFDSLAVIPLTVEGRSLGAVAFSFRMPREFSTEVRAFMLATAQQAANALERAQRHEAERRARDQLAFIAGTSEMLSKSLDLDLTLERLASAAVPKIADWCAVDLATDEGIRNLIVSHVDPEKVDMARELRERYPPDLEAPTGVPNVVRTGRSELHAEISDEVLVAAAEDDEHLRRLRALGITSGMIVPLKAHGVTLGAITFVAAESGRSYGEEDLAFAQELASHAALAIDNAIRYRREHEAAITLQRALLPRRLPELARVELAARYLPAGPEVEAGGDWYDVIDLGDDELMLVIGDVSGRGIAAASVMGRLRIAIRAYAVDGLGPAPVAERTGVLMRDFEDEVMATAFLLRVDTRSGRCTYVRAGHLPALVRHPDRTVSEHYGQGSPPMGIAAHGQSIPDEELELPPGSTVLLYTDGLIERRDAPIDRGIEELKGVFGPAPADLERCLDAVIDALHPGPAADDVAVLAMRLSD